MAVLLFVLLFGLQNAWGSPIADLSANGSTQAELSDDEDRFDDADEEAPLNSEEEQDDSEEYDEEEDT